MSATNTNTNTNTNTKTASNPALLSKAFLDGFPDFPANMNALGRFVFLRTYARLLPALKRREVYKEVCRRVAEYNVGLAVEHLQGIGYAVDWKKMQAEAENLFKRTFSLQQFASGRTMWIGGTKAAEKTKLGNFNCSFLNIKSWEDLGDLFYMLLVGTGVGFKCTKAMAAGMPAIRVNTTLLHSDYKPLPPSQRLEHTHFNTLPNGFAKIYIGDSKEGWVEALRQYFLLLTDPKYEFVHTIKISYNSIRPNGARLVTFGGQASGPEPLREMFQGINDTLKGKLDPSLAPIVPGDKGYGQVRPIHILDIGNLIGYNVVVGGVRRCLPADSLVHLKRGLVPIQEVKVGDEALTSHGYRGVTDWFDQGERDLVRIVTQDGDFTCTENHRMPVLTEINKYEWVEAGKLQPGQRLITSRQAVEGVKTELPIYENKEGGHAGAQRKLISVPPLDADMAWMVGMFHADGCTSEKKVNVVCGGDEKDIAEKVVSQLRRFGDLNVRLYQQEKDCLLIDCCSTALADYFRTNFKRSHEPIRVPSWILQSTLENRLAYIAGVMDGDGTASENIVLSTIYEDFARDMQKLLYSCGIESRLKTWRKGATKYQEPKNVFYLKLITRRSIRMVGEIPQLHKELKQIKQSQHCNGFPVPFCKDLDYELRRNLYDRKQLSLDRYDDKVKEATFCPVEIVRIVPAGKGRTYDITVDGPNEAVGVHEFFVNGYLSHNTAEIFLFDADDYETMFAKYGINGLWTEDAVAHHKKLDEMLEAVGVSKPAWFDGLGEVGKGRFSLNHRRMSNNSIAFNDKPTMDFLSLVFMIMRGEGEPGFINLGAANKRRPHCEGLNPCLTGDAMILTAAGLVPISDLLGKKFTAVVNGEHHDSTDAGFWKTGTKPVFKLSLANGQEIKATDNHQFYVQTGKKIQDWREVKDLKVGDELVIGDNADYKWESKDGTFEEGYFCGQLIGDGTFYETKQETSQPCLDLWVPEEHGLEGYRPAQIISSWAKTLTQRSDAVGFKLSKSHKGDGYQKYRMNIAAFRDVAEKYGIHPLEKKVYERGSHDFSRGLLQGLFDADGSVQGDQRKGVSVRLCQADLGRLQAVQRLLLAMGIYSTIYQNRRPAGKRECPDGHGGKKEYECKATHELIISKDALFAFESIVGFADNDKAAQLKYVLSQYKRKPNHTKFTSKIASIEPAGEEDVYDATIPTVHCFSANGIIAHNCAEVLLDSYGVCNLSTVNLVAFVKHDKDGRPYLDMAELEEAQRLSARIGLRMTLVKLELPHWNAVQQRDRLLGTSLTGVKDAMGMLGYTAEQEAELVTGLGKVARDEADKYAKEMRVNSPLLVTTVKPEGTLSQVAGGVSSGLHWSHSPYFIRRIRINAADPLAKTVQQLGWVVNPEVGTPGATHEERMKNARTLVIDFPVKSGATKTKFDVDVKEQFETYFTYQRHYTEHNSSNTITVRPGEWDTAREIIYANWDDFVGVSFLQLDGGSYALAPYEACDEKTYLELEAKMKPMDMELLSRNENIQEADFADFTMGKTAGSCSKIEDDIESKVVESKVVESRVAETVIAIKPTKEVSDGKGEEFPDSIEIRVDEEANSECANGVCPLR
jgi:intein/homing endonuclease